MAADSLQELRASLHAELSGAIANWRRCREVEEQRLGDLPELEVLASDVSAEELERHRQALAKAQAAWLAYEAARAATLEVFTRVQSLRLSVSAALQTSQAQA